jgi:hypothetical protein
MLGKRSQQQGLFGSDQLYLKFVGGDSFYGRVNPLQANEKCCFETKTMRNCIARRMGDLELHPVYLG